MYTKLIVISLLVSQVLFGQERLNKAFPHQGVSLQFAGSVGFLSAGYYRRTKKENIELSVVYGYTPRSFGGSLHSVSSKFSYRPFSIRLGKNVSFEPIQCGAFLSQNFGKNLEFVWSINYPYRYYWWPSSLRQHVFLSSQLTCIPNSSRKETISAYFEANTNDLYLYSYLPNRGAITLYDILFFGIGTKITF